MKRSTLYLVATLAAAAVGVAYPFTHLGYSACFFFGIYWEIRD